MKYKTVFRLVLRAMGVYFTIEGICGFISQLGWMFQWLQNGTMIFGFIAGLAGSLVQLAAGFYLLFGGKWVLNRLIPSNRPYCPECAYDLTGAASERCPECGTPFRWDDVRPGKSER